MFSWDGDISEVLVYDRALTGGELEQAERYLATRYNLPAKQRVPVAPMKDPVKAAAEDRALVVNLYLSALCREPSAEELNAALAHLAGGDRRAGLEDIFWAMLNLNVCLCQH